MASLLSGVSFGLADFSLYSCPAQYDSDIALVHIADKVSFTNWPGIKPVCMPPLGSDYAGRDATVTGWGTTSSGECLALYRESLWDEPRLRRHVIITVLMGSLQAARSQRSSGM